MFKMSNDALPAPSPYSHRKSIFIFTILSGIFVANAMIAEFIGVKVFSLEKTVGADPLNYEIWEGIIFTLKMSTGALLWPGVFIMTDIINEYYGKRGVKMLSYITIGLILYSFVIIYFSMTLPPEDMWLMRDTGHGYQINMQHAFEVIFGQGMWIIIGSMVAFLIGQVVDVGVFHYIKQLTGEKLLWLRATGSTLISQLIDTYVVLIIAFHLNPNLAWPLETVLLMGLVKYVYKFFMAILMTPVIYLVHVVIDRYLGEPLATQMKNQAMNKDGDGFM
jgi:uncharacterized integral membrane protein (TIGR00697 family)